MKKIMKRLSTLAMAGLLVFCLVPSASATATADLDQPSYFVEDLGNGVTKETTITVEPSLTRETHTKRVTSKNEFKYNGEYIATVNLIVTFKYDGNRAWVTDTSYSKSLTSGWSYTHYDIISFGASANLTGLLKNGAKKVDVDISLKCNPDGSLS